MHIGYLGLKVFTIVHGLRSHAPSYYLMIAHNIQTFLLHNKRTYLDRIPVSFFQKKKTAINAGPVQVCSTLLPQ